jgi:hypothetical protein
MTEAKELNETMLHAFLSGLGYSFFATEEDFMHAYPLSIPYTAPCSVPRNYPEKDEYPLWAKEVGHVYQSDGPDEYILSYISMKEAVAAHENMMHSIKEADVMSQLNFIDKTKVEIDALIWKVFDEYIHFSNILFNGPDHWVIDSPYVVFHGTDGCRGCYDTKELKIHFKYFNDPKELVILKENLEKERQDAKDAAQNRIREKELAQLAELQEKYKKE